jgi:hypothetical protein
MKNLNLKFVDFSNNIVHACTGETFLENPASVATIIDSSQQELRVRLYAGKDYMGFGRSCNGRVSKKWLESDDVRDRYNQITLMRQAINGEYTEEQKELIQKYIDNEYHDEKYLECRKSDRMFCYNNTLVQVFAVFGGTARQLLAAHDLETGDIMLPVIIGGTCLCREFTGDEGSAGGVAHLMYSAKRKYWFVCEVSRLPWLYTEELTMSRQEVTDRIVTEIEMGHNVLFPKPAGWA